MRGPITQYPSPKHPAIDIACLPGTPVVAAHGGQLVSYFDANMGNVAVIKGQGHESLYAHLDTVVKGQSVDAGKQIGTCGNTGRLSTGPHLHFAVEKVVR